MFLPLPAPTQVRVWFVMIIFWPDWPGKPSLFTQLEYEIWLSGQVRQASKNTRYSHTASTCNLTRIMGDGRQIVLGMKLRGRRFKFFFLFSLKNKYPCQESVPVLRFAMCERNPLSLNNYLCGFFTVEDHTTTPVCTVACTVAWVYSTVQYQGAEREE